MSKMPAAVKLEPTEWLTASERASMHDQAVEATAAAAATVGRGGLDDRNRNILMQSILNQLWMASATKENLRLSDAHHQQAMLNIAQADEGSASQSEDLADLQRSREVSAESIISDGASSMDEANASSRGAFRAEMRALRNDLVSGLDEANDIAEAQFAVNVRGLQAVVAATNTGTLSASEAARRQDFDSPFARQVARHKSKTGLTEIAPGVWQPVGAADLVPHAHHVEASAEFEAQIAMYAMATEGAAAQRARMPPPMRQRVPARPSFLNQAQVAHLQMGRNGIPAAETRTPHW